MFAEQRDGRANFEIDIPEEHCGIFGLYVNNPEAVNVGVTIAHALYGLQHRGSEGGGIEGRTKFGIPCNYKFDGLVNGFLTQEIIDDLSTNLIKVALVHLRYSTSGKTTRDANQPFTGPNSSFIHNGNLTNALEIIKLLPPELQASNIHSDSHVAFLAIAAAPYGTLEERMKSVFSKVEGAANFIMYGEGKLYGYRDPWGFRPLVIGQLADNGGFVLSSEPNFFQGIGARVIREVMPGEGVVIDDNGVRTFFKDKRTETIKAAHCLFEHLYFGASDSTEIFGKSNSTIRRAIGAKLARHDYEHGFYPDGILPVQHSGITYAEGYAMEMIKLMLNDPQQFGLTIEEAMQIVPNLVPQTGLVLNVAAGRVFITNGNSNRSLKVEVKHRADRAVIKKNKKIVVVDDSIVRYLTAKTLEGILEQAGAKEIHWRIGSSPIDSPCFMGIDFATKQQLIAYQMNGDINAIRQAIGCDSLVYATHRDMLEAATGADLSHIPDEQLFEFAHYCGACFTGIYPQGINPCGVLPK